MYWDNYCILPCSGYPLILPYFQNWFVYLLSQCYSTVFNTFVCYVYCPRLLPSFKAFIISTIPSRLGSSVSVSFLYVSIISLSRTTFTPPFSTCLKYCGYLSSTSASSPNKLFYLFFVAYSA